MKKHEKDFDHTKNKLAGKVKEGVGRITGNEQLELKGKMQSSKADFKKKMSITNKIEDVKESTAKIINDRIDKKKMENKKQKQTL